ncbi:MAG: SH3 domain-containing protein, partial [Anaerolineae bacterium]
MKIRAVLFVFVLLVLGVVVPVLAQVECPDIVANALQSVDEACTGTGNNQVCYGNVSIQATPQQGVSNFSFERTGDLANLTDLQTLALGGLDEGEGTWGVALMRVRANIPDTLPGQNVTFLLFGDVVVENAVAEQAVLLPVARLDADVNVRARPDPEARLIAALVSGQTLNADGRLEDGSWLRVQNPVDNDGNIVASVGWVSTAVVSV